jgi:hypothetical protein
VLSFLVASAYSFLLSHPGLGLIVPPFNPNHIADGVATRCGLDSPEIDPDGGEIFRTSPRRPWVSFSLLYSWYRVFLGVKLPERDTNHLPISKAEVADGLNPCLRLPSVPA